MNPKNQKLMNIIFVALIVIVAFGTYANVFHNAFVYDDEVGIVDRDFVKSLNNFPKLFQKAHFTRPGEPFYRPITTFSAMLDYHFWKMNTFGWHLTNVSFHALNAVLIFLIMLFIFKNNILAFLTGLFFAVHPIMTEAVAGIANRGDIFAMFFLLLSFLLYIKNSRETEPRRDAVNRVSTTIFSLIFFTLALFSKEPALVFPLILILYDLLFVIKDKSQVPQRIFTNHLYYWIVAALFIIGQLTIFHTPYRAQLATYPQGSFYYAIVSQFVVMAKYIKLLILPLPSNLNMHPIFPLTKSILAPKAIFSILLFIAVIAAGIFAWRKNKLISFAIFWFYIALLPTSNLIPYTEGLIGERYLYIPALGFCLILGYLGSQAVDFFGKKQLKAVPILLICALAAFYCVCTIQRNQTWKDSYTLWSDAVKKSPGAYKAHHNLAVAYGKMGNLDKSLEELKISEKLNPNYDLTYYNLSTAYYFKDNIKDAYANAVKAVTLEPGYPPSHINLGVICAAMNKKSDAVKEFETAIKLDPYASALAYNNLAAIYSQDGKNDEAIVILKKSMEINPNFTQSYVNLGIAYARINKIDEAILEFEKAIQTNPKYFDAYFYLGKAYLQKNEPEKAVAVYNEALKCKPTPIQAYVVYYTMGNIFMETKRDKESAVKCYEFALKLLNPDTPEAKKLKAKIEGFKK